MAAERLRKLSPRQFYDFLPQPQHSCGDIWLGLPSGGLLGSALVTGVVVTPACDLSNQKAETITYLPLIPVRSYFSTLGALPDLHGRLGAQLQAAGIQLQPPWREKSFVPPTIEGVAEIDAALVKRLADPSSTPSQRAAGTRARAGLRIAQAVAGPELCLISGTDLSDLFGKDWKNIKAKIAKNSFSNYLHFLPSDGQDRAFSGVPEHSVVLFRYPMTASIEIFDLAGHTTDAAWPTEIERTARFLPGALAFRGKRPIKAISLRVDFLHDLLSRYLAVYARLGSPDFTEETVTTLCEEMDR